MKEEIGKKEGPQKPKPEDSIYNVVFDYLMMIQFMQMGLIDDNFDYDLASLPLISTANEVQQMIKLAPAKLLIHILEKRVKPIS